MRRHTIMIAASTSRANPNSPFENIASLISVGTALLLLLAKEAGNNEGFAAHFLARPASFGSSGFRSGGASFAAFSSSKADFTITAS